MALFKKKLSVDERMFYESFPAFVPLDALCRGIKQAGTEVGLNLSTSIEEVKAEGVDRQAVKIQGNVPNAGSVEMFIVQSSMGNVHFFAGYWEGLVTFKENFGLQMIQGGGFFADIVRGQLQRGKDVKFARAYDFLTIVNDTVIPRAIELYAAGALGSEQEPQTPQGPQVPQTPKPQTPKPQAPKPQTPKPQAPKPQTPKPQTPKPQTPKPQTPKPQTPKPQTPKPQTPKASTQPLKHDTIHNKLVTLTREEAATGCVKMIPLSDGRTAKVTIPAGIKTDSHVDVPGEGRLDPNTGKRGILRLSFYIQ